PRLAAVVARHELRAVRSDRLRAAHVKMPRPPRRKARHDGWRSAGGGRPMTLISDPFTPPSLRRRRAAPTFHLRPEALGGPRAWTRAIYIDGAQHYSLADLREEALRTLERLWAPEAYAGGVSTLRGLWARIDAAMRWMAKWRCGLDEQFAVIVEQYDDMLGHYGTE